MPTESLNSLKPADSIPLSSARPTLMTSPRNDGDGELKKTKKKVMEVTKPAVMEPKIKTCICSPTTHPGSFRCHLHRASATRKKSCRSVAKGTTGMGNGGLNKLNSKLQSGQPVISRFSRVISSLKLKPIPESNLPG
ncbi:hypothetical protein DITRI_Ditri13aG0122700 [Diplodiscus trichospermus]